MAIFFGQANTFSARMEGPFGSIGNSVKLTELSLPALNWKGAVSPFFQQLTVEGISASSKVDLQPSPEQLALFQRLELAMTTENDGGYLTVWALGKCPQEDMTIQATITEVNV